MLGKLLSLALVATMIDAISITATKKGGNNNSDDGTSTEGGMGGGMMGGDSSTWSCYNLEGVYEESPNCPP